MTEIKMRRVGFEPMVSLPNLRRTEIKPVFIVLTRLHASSQAFLPIHKAHLYDLWCNSQFPCWSYSLPPRTTLGISFV